MWSTMHHALDMSDHVYSSLDFGPSGMFSRWRQGHDGLLCALFLTLCLGLLVRCVRWSVRYEAI